MNSSAGGMDARMTRAQGLLAGKPKTRENRSDRDQQAIKSVGRRNGSKGTVTLERL